MKVQMIYCCEMCATQFSDPDAAREHEASHFGLLVEEYSKWGELVEAAEEAGHMTSVCQDDETRQKFDEAVTALVAFEKAHKLVGRKPLNMARKYKNKERINNE